MKTLLGRKDNEEREIRDTGGTILRLRHELAQMDKIGDAAVAFVNSYQDHIGRCRACDVAWTNLRAALVEHGDAAAIGEQK